MDLKPWATQIGVELQTRRKNGEGASLNPDADSQNQLRVAEGGTRERS